MGVNLVIQGRQPFSDELVGLSVRATRGSEIGTREGAVIIQRAIQEFMDGPMPPKSGGSDPARRTGNLFDSVKMRAIGGSVGEGRWTYEVYADTDQAPYARRIELGFTGTDSLGRSYNQPPYPFFSKGLELAVEVGAIEDVFFAAYEEALH